MSDSLPQIDHIREVLQRNPSARVLHSIWEQRDSEAMTFSRSSHELDPARLGWFKTESSVDLDFLTSALNAEEFLLVSDVFHQCFRYWSSCTTCDPSILARMSVAYASARRSIGDTGEAFRQLEPWCRRDDLCNDLKASILLHLGHILKDEFVIEPDSAARLQIGERAVHYYQLAQDISPDSGQAAVASVWMLLALSSIDESRQDAASHQAKLALDLINRLESESGPTLQTTLWKAISLAGQKRSEEALQQYYHLKHFGIPPLGFLAEARHDSRTVAVSLGKSPEHFYEAFPPLNLVVFCGVSPKVIDATFSLESVAKVRETVAHKLDDLGARAALCGAAAGYELLFAEAMLNRLDAKLDIVLPWAKNEFLRTSIAPFEGCPMGFSWGTLFQRVLAEASRVRELGQLFEPGASVDWQFTQEVTAGIALIVAKQLRLDLLPIGITDPRLESNTAEMSSSVQLWQGQLGVKPVMINLPQEQISLPFSLPSARSEKPTLHREVKTMLFADVVGYCKLTESVMPEFVEVFLGRLSQLISQTSTPPRYLNMWGDAIYAVFDYASEAGAFATELTRLIHSSSENWVEKGLYSEQLGPDSQQVLKVPLNLRVGLHTGPILIHYNPVVRQIGFTGAHVNRAARLEPVTAIGEVYGTEEFAAMLEIDRCLRKNKGTSPEPVVCAYVGTMQLAKGYPGGYRVYRVSSKPEMPVERLAEAVHNFYCESQKERYNTHTSVFASLPWQQLPPDLQNANRLQVSDIPYKLNLLGYELTESIGQHPCTMAFLPSEVDFLAQEEHERWSHDRQRAGWQYGPIRDDARKRHPSLVPWSMLPETEKEKDRDVIRQLPKLIAKAGLRINRYTTH